jgi:hypothetical protein
MQHAFSRKGICADYNAYRRGVIPEVEGRKRRINNVRSHKAIPLHKKIEHTKKCTAGKAGCVVQEASSVPLFIAEKK